MEVLGQNSGSNHEEMSESGKDLAIEFAILRLPVEMLVRFKCVSQYWRDLINSEEFQSLYLHHSNTSRDKFHVFVSSRRRQGQKNIHKLGFVDDTPNQVLQEIYSKRFKKDYEIVGSCNGLICLYCDMEFKLALWNPFTRRYKMLPMAKVNRIQGGEQHLSHGLGCVKDDYKVVQIIQSFKKGNLLETEIKVYSLKLNSWTKVEDFPFGGSDFPNNGCFLDGDLYWLAWTKPTAKHLLVRFELEAEKFDQLELPNVDDSAELHLGVLGGCLSMCESKEDSAVIWVVKKRVPWAVQDIVRLEDSDQASYFKIMPLAYTNKGKKLLLAVGFNTLLWYDLKDNEAKEFFLPRFTKGFEAVMCIESLVSLGVDSKADE
ncbi:F-box protein CPR1-like [Pistacia vera]|uniref:F-box protein CPR1-like n=1 Tax=Pistacia vera TaxID=55513 RepID=UPI001262D0D6|nr:F-box protein CPR1-like [Pistacia vera]